MTKQGSWNSILNALKTLLLAVIAVALVKFAFFPPHEVDETQSLNPAGEYGAITVFPEISTITNTVNLQGTIQPDTPAAVKATLAGEITEIYVKDGDTVNAGDRILLIQKEMLTEPEEYFDAQSMPQMTKPQKYYENAWVTAPAAGKVSLNALVSQMVNVGDPVASIQPPTFSAVATLSPDQMYRLQDLPQKATLTIKNGPAPFDCQGVRIATPQKAPGADGSNSGGSTIEARCAIPTNQKVFPGLQVTMALIAGEAKDVLTVPVSAVEGRFEAGVVYLPAFEGGEPTPLQVKLGLTDGRRIQVVEGLSADQEILEFIPGKKVDEDPRMGGMGGMGGLDGSMLMETPADADFPVSE